jgi:hypothetical protein
MHGNANRPAGHEPADTCGPDDHPRGIRWALRLIRQALKALEYSNRQEAQEARSLIAEAIGALEER